MLDLEHAIDHHRELGKVERFGQIVGSTCAHRGDRGLHGAKCGHHDHRDRLVARAQLLDQLDAVHAGHLEICHDDVGSERFELAERLEGIGCHLDLVALVAQQLRQCGPRIDLVVDDQDPSPTRHSPLYSENHATPGTPRPANLSARTKSGEDVRIVCGISRRRAGTRFDQTTGVLCTCKHLRDLADHCEQVANEVDLGRGELAVLIAEVASLRAAFDAHRTTKRDSCELTACVAPLRIARAASPAYELRLGLDTLRDYLADEMRCSVKRQDARLLRSTATSV